MTATGYRLWQGRVSLNWSRQPGHWGGGRRRPCRFCRRPSFLLDDNGQPVHKVCLEQAMTAALAETGRRAA